MTNRIPLFIHTHLADDLVLAVYKTTRAFPSEERFGLTSPLRRAAVLIVSNIVEGCARNSQADYVHFLDMAYSSAREVEYQLSLARRLEYLAADDFDHINTKCEETAKVLNGLIRALRSS